MTTPEQDLEEEKGNVLPNEGFIMSKNGSLVLLQHALNAVKKARKEEAKSWKDSNQELAESSLRLEQKARFETAKQFEKNVCKPTRIYLKHLIRRFPQTTERVELIISRMKEELEKLQEEAKNK